MMARTIRGRIVPRDDGAAPLDIVIAVMAFLAALALGASLVAERTAQSWRAGLADRLTVQILPPARGNAGAQIARETKAAIAVLNATDGIVSVRALPQSEELSLVKPWLGAGALVADLPLPQLIDATLSPGAAVDLPALAARLKQSAPHAVLDDHTHWIGRMKALAGAVLWSSFGILALIAIATAATVAFATRASLDAHHDIVALLHQMGAHSGFIASAFERHYFVATVVASAFGALLAAALFLLAGGLELFGVEAVPFLPPMALHLAEVAWLAAVPLGSGLIAWTTARLSVLAALRRIY